jgi:hypothetical protein
MTAVVHGSLTSAAAAEHVQDLLRSAARSRIKNDLPARNPHRTPRRRTTWWTHVTVRFAGT